MSSFETNTLEVNTSASYESRTFGVDAEVKTGFNGGDTLVTSTNFIKDPQGAVRFFNTVVEEFGAQAVGSYSPGGILSKEVDMPSRDEIVALAAVHSRTKQDVQPTGFSSRRFQSRPAESQSLPLEAASGFNLSSVLEEELGGATAVAMMATHKAMGEAPEGMSQSLLDLLTSETLLAAGQPCFRYEGKSRVPKDHILAGIITPKNSVERSGTFVSPHMVIITRATIHRVRERLRYGTLSSIRTESDNVIPDRKSRDLDLLAKQVALSAAAIALARGSREQPESLN